MPKVIKLKQKDIENVVLKVIQEQEQSVDTETQDIELEPSTEKILQAKNLEVRPEVTPDTPAHTGVYIGKDAQGNYFVVDYKTGEIVGKKSGL